jgi:hypothetical protein
MLSGLDIKLSQLSPSFRALASASSVDFEVSALLRLFSYFDCSLLRSHYYQGVKPTPEGATGRGAPRRAPSGRPVTQGL